MQEFWWVLSGNEAKTKSVKRREVDALCEELFCGDSLASPRISPSATTKPPKDKDRTDKRSRADASKPKEEDGKGDASGIT